MSVFMQRIGEQKLNCEILSNWREEIARLIDLIVGFANRRRELMF